ncbi:MAG: DNA-formamidopyrimidine glycosylase family protein [Chloroflexota bacterium]|jgi:formamidopyrimidine-DNA glycosylase
MPELPEIACRARQMNHELSGKVIQSIEVLQPKCLNMPVGNFQAALHGAKIIQVSYQGKWIFVNTTNGWLLLNLGMGGEILLVTRASLPEKYRLIFDFADSSCLAVNFWWFGYAHYVSQDQLHTHEMTRKLGRNALDLQRSDFKQLLTSARGKVKPFLLDQSKIAGIGNAYIHDILFLARLHPLRALSSLQESDIDRLFDSIQTGLRTSLDKNGAFYEVDLHGWRGSFTMDDILIGYKEGKPCPACSTPIEKIRTGSTSSFICPSCQSL